MSKAGGIFSDVSPWVGYGTASTLQENEIKINGIGIGEQGFLKVQAGIQSSREWVLFYKQFVMPRQPAPGVICHELLKQFEIMPGKPWQFAASLRTLRRPLAGKTVFGAHSIDFGLKRGISAPAHSLCTYAQRLCTPAQRLYTPAQRLCMPAQRLYMPA